MPTSSSISFSRFWATFPVSSTLCKFTDILAQGRARLSAFRSHCKRVLTVAQIHHPQVLAGTRCAQLTFTVRHWSFVIISSYPCALFRDASFRACQVPVLPSQRSIAITERSAEVMGWQQGIHLVWTSSISGPQRHASPSHLVTA